MTVTMDVTLQLNVLIEPMLWYSAFRLYPAGNLFSLSHLLCLPLSDLHTVFLMDNFVCLDFLLLTLEYLGCDC